MDKNRGKLLRRLPLSFCIVCKLFVFDGDLVFVDNVEMKNDN